MHQRDDKFPDNGFEAWGGYMRAKIAKLEEQFLSKYEKEKIKLSNIFNGISIYVNGYTLPTADELKELMAQHGGIYHTYQRNEDFIIASNLPDTKVKNMSLQRVIKPEWITDSIKSNQLLHYKDYLLYRNSKTQPRLNFQVCDEKNNDQKCQNNSNNKLCMKVENNLINHASIICDNQIRSCTNDINIKKTATVTKTASDPKFISEFYNNSRLHHISQLGAHFKQLINELRDNSKFTFPAREHLKKQLLCQYEKQNNVSQEIFQNNKIIMHIDMDCFFVSVGIRDKPELKGKPVAVTHSKGVQPRSKRPGVDREFEFSLYRHKQAQKINKTTVFLEQDINFTSKVDNVSNENEEYGSMSEIASCSYEARAKGIKNGMFMGPALKLCPNLQTISYDFEGYKEVAQLLYDTIAQYTLDIEAVSCDEMYVDCTELLASLNVSVYDFATCLRDEIKSKTGCPCSTGFGGNRLQARLATKQAKPDGQFFLTDNLVKEFMFNIKLKDLPGVGRQTAHKLESLGHETCGSLQNLTLGILQKNFGNKTGSQLFDQCRGHDSNCLSFYNIRKSVSAEVNYGIRFENMDQCEEFLKQLSEEVHSRMNQYKVMGKCITLKFMVRAQNAPVETAKFMGHGFCDIINKSATLTMATNDIIIITKEVTDISRKLNIDPKEMRGVGIQITKLEPLNNKEKKGALNKFFTIVKTENTKAHRKLYNVCQKIENYDNKEIRQPTTPKKKKVNLSPLKKSPILGHIKSPINKKRGKSSKLKLNIPTSKNVMSKFLQGQATEGLVLKTAVTKKKEGQEKFKYNQEKHKNVQPQGLSALPWQKVRELLRAWFDSGLSPKICDVNFIAIYMQEMVMNNNIEKLNILIKFIKRRVHEIDSSVWYDVENCVIEQVQSAMLAVYGKKLFISDD